MVNHNSPIYNYSEKIGLVIGKGLRVVIVGGIVFVVGALLGGSSPSPTPTPTTEPAPSPGPPVP